MAEAFLHRTIGSGKLHHLDFPKFAKTRFDIDFWPLPAQPWPEIDGVLSAKRLLERVREKFTAG